MECEAHGSRSGGLAKVVATSADPRIQVATGVMLTKSESKEQGQEKQGPRLLRKGVGAQGSLRAHAGPSAHGPGFGAHGPGRSRYCNLHRTLQMVRCAHYIHAIFVGENLWTQ